MNNARVIIFAKAPIAGKVKTRLIAKIGAKRAAQLAKKMLIHTIENAAKCDANSIEVRLEGNINSVELLVYELPQNLIFKPQGNGDIGARMARASMAAVKEGDMPIIIGTDCPDLNADILNQAINGIANTDILINPAFDGGYVLIAAKQYYQSLFEEIAWSTPHVLRQTIDKIQAQKLNFTLGETLHDIDMPEDLEFLPADWRDELKI